MKASALAVLLAVFTFTAAIAAQLPDRTRTPGAIVSSITATICRPGYAHAVRNVPYHVRDAVYTAYGIPRGHRTPGGGYVGPRRGYVIDHLVPLELGGANSPRNLWPQPRAEAHAKDRVEDALHQAVCSGRMGLVDAQQRIARNWQHAVPTPLQLLSR
ncbi:MAG: HNH endonuclease [Candidatus Eremiobacteraeota bacterium]|nr:HNH endonuclease [Candidatus Eremiobacteraeota bacterium]MBC5804989.1 HNH endonuclease [Candidatus Eremiobacteraeota bacterium]MBC5820669.1 HNH endonuclease [Candidatus Eremiobacteraeota bacterium]